MTNPAPIRLFVSFPKELVDRLERALDHPIKIQYNVRVAMRDGVHLSADIYRPDDTARHPAIFELTPYNNNSNASIETLTVGSEFSPHRSRPLNTTV